MKIAILLSYYNRPILVKNALNSILSSHEYHKNWRLLFGDDGSTCPGKPIAEEILKDHLDKVDFVNSHMTMEDKLKNGIAIGRYANEYLQNSDADVVVTLCDDDMLCPTYLKELCVFLTKHTEFLYCYSNVFIYNPLKPSKPSLDCCYNDKFDSGNPAGRFDASQIAFRMDCFRQGCRFPESTSIGPMPYVANVDAGFYQQLYDKFGSPGKTNLTGQYKGIHEYQLVWHKKQGASIIRNYIDKVEELAGKVL